MTQTITFWGTRGSIPTPGPATTRYGGNTSCVALTNGQDQVVVLDAGSGIRALGRHLSHSTRAPIQADILLSHTHWDHIQGLPFFEPLHAANSRVEVYGARQGQVPLREILDQQMSPVVFPVPMDHLAAEIGVTEISEGSFEVGAYAVEAFRLRHQGVTLGYKLRPTRGGPTLAYITDNELGPGGDYEVAPDWREQLVRFLSGVDILIHDGMYSEEAIMERLGWGHSTPRQAVALAAECRIPRLLLFHHEPANSDEVIDRMVADARDAAREHGTTLRVDGAIEGLTVTLCKE